MSMHVLRRLIPTAAGFALLLAAIPVRAQMGSSFGSSSGSSSGSSFGSSMGSSSGSSGTSGSNTLGTTSGFLGSGTTVGSTPGMRTGTSTTTGVGATTIFGQSYVAPIALGYSGLATFDASTVNVKVVRSPTFGTAMFTYTAPRAANTNARATTGSLSTATAALYASTVGIRKGPSYVTEADPADIAIAPPSLAAMAADVRGTIDRSSRINSKGAIRVAMDGPVVVLQGTVLTARERNLVEDLVRLTPGVSFVRNELAVKTP